MRNLLCFLGFHKWESVRKIVSHFKGYTETAGGITHTCGSRTFHYSEEVCERCGKHQLFQVYPDSTLKLKVKTD